MTRKRKYKKTFRTKKRKLIFRILKNRFFWISILILSVLGAVFYFVLFSSFFQIKEFKISGNEKVPTEDIRNIVSEMANKKIFFLDSRNIFLINFKEINQKLLEKFPQIDEVNLKREFPDIVETNMKERVPIGLWCQANGCFCFCKKGVIFEEGKEEGGLIIKPEHKEAEIFLGKKVLEENKIEEILKIQKSLEEQMDIKIKEFVISLDGEKLVVKTEDAWEIYFGLGENVSDQIFNLDLVLKEKISPEEKGNLEYIDLRFENRVYFKYKESTTD
jgi:cell division septal protein FtsQ